MTRQNDCCGDMIRACGLLLCAYMIGTTRLPQGPTFRAELSFCRPLEGAALEGDCCAGLAGDSGEMIEEAPVDAEAVAGPLDVRVPTASWADVAKQVRAPGTQCERAICSLKEAMLRTSSAQQQCRLL